ncbi:PHD finger protein 3-like [Polyodon spathula]|uniref:PHD finger protein 3-like n=1 Tax=Polyodon spathula TaxID=7913 RepID=UPI001B7F334D|nr:PHD finger protein 3-like [Polyodon spathula]
MDIVDTFNRLIPSDQLDDTLLLGPNLESEVSDEFGTGHNLEDSLKNMLSDKDPMLGSASSQFHLLDNDDTNFQTAGSTVVGLQDITNEGELKESGHNIIEEEDLMLTGKSQRGISVNTALQSPRKSPRLMAQEPARHLRQSTLARRCSPSNALKKSPAKGDPGRRGEQKQHENLTGQDESESCSQESVLHSVQRERQIIPTGVSTVNPAAVAPKEEETVEDFNSQLKVKEQSSGSPTTDINMAQTQKKEDSSICQIHDTDKKISGEQDKKLFETSNSENAPNTGLHIEGNMAEVKGKASDEMQINVLGSSELGLCVNPNDVQEGPSMLLGNRMVEDQTKINIPDKSAIEPENVRGQIDAQTLGHSSVERICPDQSQDVKETQQHIDTNAEERLHPSKGQKNEESQSKLDEKYSVKKPLKSKELQSALKQHPKLLPKLQTELLMEHTFAQQRKVRTDIQNDQGPKRKQPLTAVKRKGDDLKMHQLQCAAKLQKTEGSSQDVKSKIGEKTHPKQAQVLQPSMSLKSPMSGRPANAKLAIGVVQDRSKYQQQTRPLSHMSQKHNLALSKSSFIQKDELEEDDGEKHTLKKNEKGLYRQRISSRGLSLNEPPLFIPDNAPAVKKDAPEDGASIDNEVVWDPSKNCGFCKKPHSNRFMVGCGRCDDWFHGDCVGLGLAQAQQMEQEDQEYVCLKCCAEEDKGDKSSAQNPCAKQQPSSLECHSKPEHQESRSAVKHEKLGQPASYPTGVCNLNLGMNEKTKQSDDIRKYRVKIFRKESTEGVSSESREMENRKVQSVGMRHPSGDWMEHGNREPKPGVSERQDVKKKKIEKSPFSTLSSSKKPSVEQIRQNVRESLKDILSKRLSESNLKISTDRAAKVALKTERELFSFFRDTDTKYKSKYRSLMFNLKDAKNKVLFKRVLKGEIGPDHLIRMSPEELASKELAAWRKRENQHTIEMIEKEQRDVERRPITKITHKGEIEIENQEQVKEPEVMEIEEPVPKPVEEPEEVTEEADSESTKDTTSQHKKHLFDLNCKICTGKMTNCLYDNIHYSETIDCEVKVATSVIRRQSNVEGEILVNTASTYSEDLPFSAQDEKNTVSPSASFCDEGRFNASGNAKDEAAFLARLESLWKGFINMPSVAKFVIKAYPVSGILDHLTEDLPDSIQVGGRISPQMVWDYVEKIRASGTKEVCLIRFCPVTEEDQISYTLLYAYFSSRKRYGVVANNMKQVKDMYLIPLASSEKVPHHLVPFDGPGLEARRPNLLLGLIIRQRVKRDFVVVLPVEAAEMASNRSLPEKSKTDLPNEAAADEEKDLNSLAPILLKHHNKPQQSSEDEEEESKEPTSAVENVLQEPTKPLRFLPGVLVGWENQTSPLDLASKPLSVDDILRSLLGTTGKVTAERNTLDTGTVSDSPSNKSPPLNTPRSDRFIVKRREIKVKSEHNLQDSTSPTDGSKQRDYVDLENSRATSSVSLKDKPPDVSTEAFLANISPVKTEEENKSIPQHTEQQMNDQQKAEKESKDSLYLEHASNGSVCPVTVSCTFGEDNTSPGTSKSLFLIPKRDPRQAAGRNLPSSATDSFHDGDGNRNVITKEDTIKIENTLLVTKANFVPRDQCQGYNLPTVLNTGTEQQSFSYQQGTKYLPVNEEIQHINTVPSFRRGPDFSLSSHGQVPGPVAGHFPQAEFPANNIPPAHLGGPGFHFQRMPNSDFSANTLSDFQPQHPQVPPLFGFPRGPPPVFHPSESEVQNHGLPWPPPASFPPSFPPHHTGLAPSGPHLPYDSRYGGSSKPHMIMEDKGPERSYSDPWNRQPQHSEKSDRSEHQSRQRYYSESHHERKGRHHERDYERDRDKYGERYSEKDGHRERSRSRDEKNRERRRSQEERHRGKDRDRHGAEHLRGERHPERPRDRHRSEEYSSRSDKEREKTREREKDKRKDSDYEKVIKDTKSKDEKHL